MYMEPKKYNKLVNITKKEQTHKEQTSVYECGEGVGVRLEQGNNGYKPLCVK